MNWIKDKLKRFWKLVLVGVFGATAFAFNFPPQGASVLNTDSKLQSAIQDYENNQLSNGKYKRIDSKQQLLDSGFNIDSKYKDIKVIEYVSDKGSGYQILLITWTDGTISSKSGEPTIRNRMIKSIGFGPEAGYRTYDWTAQ